MDGQRDWNGTLGTGWTAVAAGVLLMVSTGVELVHGVQAPSGRVVEPVTYAALVAMWGLAMVGVARTFLFFRALHTGADVGLTRAGRVGVRSGVLGAVLQVAFALVSLITAAATGSPWEGAFLFFGLGFLALIVGGIALGFGLRRSGVLRTAAVPLWSGSAAAVLAIVIGVDPWHDIALFGYYASWIAVGLLFMRGSRALAAVSENTGAAGSPSSL
jgi:hypothetical protein